MRDSAYVSCAKEVNESQGNEDMEQKLPGLSWRAVTPVTPP